MQSDPKFMRKMLILWGAVILVYAAMFILTDPLIMIPRETRQDIYEEFSGRINPDDCQPSILTSLNIVTSNYEITERSAYRIILHGYRNGWGDIPCTWGPIGE